MIPNFSRRIRISNSKNQDSPIDLSPLLSDVKISKTIEIHSLTKQMEANGQEVVSLCVGEPDFPPPQQVLDATVAAVLAGETKYTAVTGSNDLKNEICKYLSEKKNVKYSVNEIIVGNGAKQGVYHILSDHDILSSPGLLGPIILSQAITSCSIMCSSSGQAHWEKAYNMKKKL